MNESDFDWIKRALQLAHVAASYGEVPVGALLVKDNAVVGRGFNCPILKHDPTAHAEMIALSEGAKTIGNYRLLNTTLYVTLEPCLMCAGAMIHARIKRLVFGAFDPKGGAIVSRGRVLDLPYLNHRVDHKGGVLAEPCGEILQHFFLKRR